MRQRPGRNATAALLLPINIQIESDVFTAEREPIFHSSTNNAAVEFTALRRLVGLLPPSRREEGVIYNPEWDLTC